MNGGKKNMEKKDLKYLKDKSLKTRRKVIDFHKRNRISHLGSDLSSVEIMTSLYYHIMRESDRFILSKGHASGIFYIILNDLGKIPDEQLNCLEEHPTIHREYGIYATTGSLGQGLSLGLGMALANPKSSIYVLMGDGECEEGQIWEAARYAGELGRRVSNLTGIVDCNGLQGFKKTDYSSYERRFSAFGLDTRICEGHNIADLIREITRKSDSAKIVLARTIKGKGVPSIEGQLKSHYSYQ